MTFDAILLDVRGNCLYATPRAHAQSLPETLKYVATMGEQRVLTADVGGTPHVVTVVPLNGAVLALVREDPGPSTLIDFIASVDFSFDILEHFLTNPYEGVTVVDTGGRLRFISPVHEKFFGMSRRGYLGRPVKDIIENTRLNEVAKSGKPEIGQIQEMRGVSRVVNRVPIHRNGKVVGAIGQVMFKTPEQVHALSQQISALRSQVEHYRKELVHLQQKTFGIAEIIGDSAPIQRLKERVRKVAAFDVPVFISGESGTGKELVAQAIHGLSNRQDQSLVVVNCGSLPESLVESELFGYESGAFTGARKEGRVGKFELANNSSLFLDEIGDMPMETQVKLLRVLENGSFERLGSNREKKTNFRLISATNRDLRRRIIDEEFRADLYFRINGITLHIPPLRERVEDIPLLVAFFLERLARRMGTEKKSATPEALSFLMSQPWPGNVRQLQNVLQRACVFSESSELTEADFLDIEMMDVTQPPPDLTAAESGKYTIRENVEKVELALIREALNRYSGNKKRVAEELGISRSYLYKKLAEIDG